MKKHGNVRAKRGAERKAGMIRLREKRRKKRGGGGGGEDGDKVQKIGISLST